MTWRSFHSRGAILRDVIATANARRDGGLPLDVAGATEAFDDELDLLGALQLRWHTRLAGRIEREVAARPADLERAVVTAWRNTAEELPGVLALLDHHRARPRDRAMAEAMGTATAKERAMLAVMAGRAGIGDRGAARVGEAIERRARAMCRPGGSSAA